MNVSHPTPLPFVSNSGAAAASNFDTAETTLRRIAQLPAPSGLEDRLHSALRVAPRTHRVLAWPQALRPDGDWMRSAAAAAIAFVIVGGGWGVYTRVLPPQSAHVVVMPVRTATPGGFASAAAVHTPTTLNRPTLAQPATGQGKARSHVPLKRNDLAPAKRIP